MKTNFLIFKLIIIAVINTSNIAFALPSFSGAEGFGTNSIHARGKNVFHVTRLDDLNVEQKTKYFSMKSVENKIGCFRWALAAAKEAGGGYIVFDLPGTIKLVRPAKVPSHTYIAGQSAPGSGISITREPIMIKDVEDVIVRHIRCRGDYDKGKKIKGKDAILIQNSERVIIDHVSISFFQDGAVDIVQSKYITLQWSHFGDAVNSMTSEPYHGEPHLVRTDSNFISMHHNYYTHIHSRAPWFTESNTNGGLVEFSNNVVYNFRKYPSAFDIPNGFGNAIGNYYIPGSNTHGDHGTNVRGPITGMNNFTIHVRDNLSIHSSVDTPGHNDKGCPGSDHDLCKGQKQYVTGSRPDNTYPEESIMGKSNQIGPTPGILNYSANRIPNIPEISYIPAEKNIDEVISKFGAWPRDCTDLRLVNELLTRTGTWKLEKPIDDNEIISEEILDQDKDGMDDRWEQTKCGDCDPNSQNLVPGYDNIEVYLQERHLSLLETAPAINAHKILSSHPLPHRKNIEKGWIRKILNKIKP
ncbi:MAG: hypothetical protein CSA29_01395 [Desulfobacterales bacterium]|nr:MAG: hypothetical protein CSA29_01395 [Desulfobacterales bacterium]